MSAFVLVLATGMAAGSGPEVVSAEVGQRLDLRGAWEGTWLSAVCRRAMTTKTRLSDGMLDITGDGTITSPCTFTDKGNGTVTMRLDGEDYEGIFRAGEKGHFILCFNERTRQRPSSFEIKRGTWLFTLRRVKPGK